MEVWRDGGMEVWKDGRMDVWKDEGVEEWREGRREGKIGVKDMERR